jgi:hypothetical protein
MTQLTSAFTSQQNRTQLILPISGLATWLNDRTGEGCLRLSKIGNPNRKKFNLWTWFSKHVMNKMLTKTLDAALNIRFSVVWTIHRQCFFDCLDTSCFCELLELTWHTDVNATQNRLFGTFCRFSCCATFID